MPIHLEQNAYGKNAIQLSRVIRHGDHHEIRQITVDISLQGDFDAAHVDGDNSNILPTDTMKNTVYALAKDHFTSSIEAFGIHLAHHFLSNNPQVLSADIHMTESNWTRMTIEGQAHPHAFINGGNEKHIAHIHKTNSGLQLSSGIIDLLILKTTDSGFEHYIKDRFTTLKETADRILATQCDITWIDEDEQPGHQYTAIRENLLRTFAGHKSASVQHTLYAMGENILRDFPSVKSITLKMPNQHHIPFNLEPFGIDNGNEIFVATKEPFGYITGTLSR